MNPKNRKTATGMTLVQWARFQYETFCLNGSTLLTGVNGGGKSMILDAMTYCLTGNNQFNKAARDRDRTVRGYVRGDTNANGADRFLRSGPVTSYIAMEFFSPLENMYLVVGVGIESPDDTHAESRWFVCRDTRLSDMNFCRIEGKKLLVTPVSMLCPKGGRERMSDLMARDQGVAQILNALGLRVDVDRYREKITKMIAFNPENNIDAFIQDCVLSRGEVRSLSQLREQKHAVEELRQTYDNMLLSRKLLMEVSGSMDAYEKKLRQLHLRELMLSWQNLLVKQEEKEQLELKKKQYAESLRNLEARLREATEEVDHVRAKLHSLEQEEGFGEITMQLDELQHDLLENAHQTETFSEKLAELKRLQYTLADTVPFLLEAAGDDPGVPEALRHLGDLQVEAERKRNAFLALSRRAENCREDLYRSQAEFQRTMDEMQIRMAEMEENIQALNAHRMILPRDVQNACRVLNRELKAQGIDTQVRTLAELVEDFTDEQWRDVVESFLGSRRYHLVIDGPYVQRALEIMDRMKLQGMHLVLTDKLPEKPAKAGSAAELLRIPNPYARRYADYLLGHMQLCASLEELHACPTGCMMKNGMVATGYAVSRYDLRRVELCLGHRALELQKTRLEEEKALLDMEYARTSDKRMDVERKLRAIREIDWVCEHYAFDAPERMEALQRQQVFLHEQEQKIRNNPDLVIKFEYYNEIRKQEQEAVRSRDELVGDRRSCQEAEQATEKELGQAAAEMYVLSEEWEKARLAHLELVDPMKKEYKESAEKSGNAVVVRERMLSALRGEVEETGRKMEDAQLEYLKVAGGELSHRGAAFIPEFRRELQNLVNVQMERTKELLHKQKDKLENTFLTDFVGDIYEKILNAREEMDALNRELKSLPFGRDTYRFVLSEKPECATFFRVAKHMHSQMLGFLSPDYTTQVDEEYQHDVDVLMEQTLSEEDEQEYSDYRKYLKYDMQIISRQGEWETVSDLSRKQGSASGGEKQTPYFIILSAALMQFYTRDRCCERMAFIDEAFHALSEDRIQQLIRYFEDNNFQVIYAAPPERIGTIGKYIPSTISLVSNGRYSHVVEGLVKAKDVTGV